MYRNFANFVEWINNRSNLISIPNQRGGFFLIEILNINHQIIIRTNGNVIAKAKNQFPVDLFELIINTLHNSENHTLLRGNARLRNARVGNGHIPRNSIEYIAAIYFNISEGQSFTSRVHIIANILVEAGICYHVPNRIILREYM